jgi:hypothetical protein
VARRTPERRLVVAAPRDYKANIVPIRTPLGRFNERRNRIRPAKTACVQDNAPVREAVLGAEKVEVIRRDGIHHVQFRPIRNG